MGLWQRFLDFLYPPRCPACNAFVAQNGQWCSTCLQKALLLRRLPLDHRERHWLSGAYALGRYHGTLGKMIKLLKYRRQLHHTAALQAFVAAATADLLLPPIDCAFYVPLHEQRYSERGFNQVEEIFAGFIAMRQLPLGRLQRVQATQRQYGLVRQERQKNLRQAFALLEPEVSGKVCLVLDDVLTSGATLAECAELLRQKGARQVYGIVLASDR